MQGLSFRHADYQGPSKTFANAGRLRQVEISTAASGNREQSFEFLVVRVPKLILIQATDIMNPTQDDQRTDLETPKSASPLVRLISAKSSAF